MTRLLLAIALVLGAAWPAAAQAPIPGVNVFKTVDGSATLPSRTYLMDLDLGSYRVGADNEGFTAGGTRRWDYNATRLNLSDGYCLSFDATGSLCDDGANIIGQRNGTTAQRWNVANTYTSASNHQVFSVDWQTLAGNLIVGVRTAATGTSGPVFFSSQAANGGGLMAMRVGTSAPFIRVGWTTTGGSFDQSVADTGHYIQLGSITSTATSGSIAQVAITPTYNQTSGTAANTDLLINRTQTAVGSGAQLLFDAQVSTVSQFSVSTEGAVSSGGSITSGGNIALAAGNGGYNLDTAWQSRTNPTIASGFGTSPSIVVANGTAAFIVDVGTGGSATSGVITMPEATTGWNCHVENRTGVLANVANQRTVQIATTTNSVTLENQTISTGAVLAWAASSHLAMQCAAY